MAASRASLSLLCFTALYSSELLGENQFFFIYILFFFENKKRHSRRRRGHLSLLIYTALYSSAFLLLYSILQLGAQHPQFFFIFLKPSWSSPAAWKGERELFTCNPQWGRRRPSRSGRRRKKENVAVCGYGGISREDMGGTSRGKRPVRSRMYWSEEGVRSGMEHVCSSTI